MKGYKGKQKESHKMSIKEFKDLPELFRTNLSAMVIRINLPSNKLRLWEGFSSFEKKILGNTFENATTKYQPWEMWKKIHNEPEPVCLIEIGYKLGLIDLTTRNEFLREINLKTISKKNEKTNNHKKPNWNKKEGKLFFNNELIRKIRLKKFPSNAEVIFTAFHKARWKSTIPNPLADKDQRTLENAIRHLKKGLSVIAFSSVRRATEISWVLCEQ